MNTQGWVFFIIIIFILFVFRIFSVDHASTSLYCGLFLCHRLNAAPRIRDIQTSWRLRRWWRQTIEQNKNNAVNQGSVDACRLYGVSAYQCIFRLHLSNNWVECNNNGYVSLQMDYSKIEFGCHHLHDSLPGGVFIEWTKNVSIYFRHLHDIHTRLRGVLGYIAYFNPPGIDSRNV